MHFIFGLFRTLVCYERPVLARGKRLFCMHQNELTYVLLTAILNIVVSELISGKLCFLNGIEFKKCFHHFLHSSVVLLR